MKARLVVTGITGLICAPFVVPLFSPWSRINCQEFEIDLVSGRKRVSRFFYGIPVRREIEDTQLSLAIRLAEESHQKARWEPVSTFGPYVHHSPHYVYHSATGQIRQLGMIWDFFEFDSAQRQATGMGLLHEWRSTGSDRTARAYLARVDKDAEQVGSSDGDQPSN